MCGWVKKKLLCGGDAWRCQHMNRADCWARGGTESCPSLLVGNSHGCNCQAPGPLLLCWKILDWETGQFLRTHRASCPLLWALWQQRNSRPTFPAPGFLLKRAFAARGLTFPYVSALINVWEMNFDSHPQQHKLDGIKCSASFQFCSFYLLAIIFSFK